MTHTITSFLKTGSLLAASSLLAVANLNASACCGAAAKPSTNERSQPNVVFILADDLGWMDLGVYGSTFHQTPNLDALAEKGLRFTDAYVASPLCAPTRASIMTGLHPARTGMTFPDIGHQVVRLEKSLQQQAPASQPALLAEPVTVLNTDFYTLGMAFRDAGYVTGHYGKWHLGRPPFSPLQHGFGVDIPHTNAPGPLMHGWFYPFHIWPDHGEPGDHLEDLLAEAAAEFIMENKDRPFFLNYWAFQVHSPWEASEEQVERYSAKADPNALQRNPVYAGMVESFDDAVGTLVAALEEAGVLDNTVIIFLSDNGPFVAAHPSPVMDPRFAHIPPTSALPLRGSKNTLYEAGIRVPQIIVWPGLTTPGTVTDALSHSNDFFPTFADILGWENDKLPDFDGVSLRPVLTGEGIARDYVFAHFPHRQDTRPYEQMPAPNSAAPAASLRQGDWKIIRFFADGEEGADRHELYNLADDLGEVNDLSQVAVERVAAMKRQLDIILADTDAIIPVRNPAFREPPRQGDWVRSPHAELQMRDGVLHMRSIGNDPWISTNKLPANAQGPFTLELEISSRASGEGRIYYVRYPTAGFGEDRAFGFAMIHDGQPQVYTLEIPVNRLGGLRIDPANAPGELIIHRIQLRDRDGEAVELSDQFYLP